MYIHVHVHVHVFIPTHGFARSAVDISTCMYMYVTLYVYIHMTGSSPFIVHKRYYTVVSLYGRFFSLSTTCYMYIHTCYMYIHTLYIHTCTTVRQQNKAIQHNTIQQHPRQLMKNELPQVGFEPTTLLSRLSALPLSYRGSSDCRARISKYNTIQCKGTCTCIYTFKIK